MSNHHRITFSVIVTFIVAALSSATGCTFRFYVPNVKAPSAQVAVGSPADAKGLSDAAYEQLNKDNNEVALQMSQKAVQLDPTLAEAHKNLALALCDLNRCDEALAHASEAVRLKPDFDKAHFVLGKTLFRLGRYQDAVAKYKEAIRVNGEYDKAHYSLGVAYDRLGDLDAAAQSLKQAVRIKPDEQNYRRKLEFLENYKRQPAQLPPPSADFEGDNYAAYNYGEQVREYLYHEQFGLLENIAREARATKKRVPGGDWKLEVFYLGLDRPSDGERASDAEWQYHIGKLKKWADFDPMSITARVGMAEAYIAYAWRARGDGLAGTVTREGWTHFRERLALAKRVLDGARDMEQKCPNWYASMMSVARGQGWDASSFDRLFDEATAFEPSYPSYYVQKATFLMPQWNGRPGDWARFVASSAERLGGKEGSVLYYQIVMSVTRSSLAAVRQECFWECVGGSWPRFEQGLADLELTYGVSAHERNRACLLAAASGEWALSRRLFQRIGGDWDVNVWRDKNEFEKYKSLAYAGQ